MERAIVEYFDRRQIQRLRQNKRAEIGKTLDKSVSSVAFGKETLLKSGAWRWAHFYSVSRFEFASLVRDIYYHF